MFKTTTNNKGGPSHVSDLRAANPLMLVTQLNEHAKVTDNLNRKFAHFIKFKPVSCIQNLKLFALQSDRPKLPGGASYT